MYTYIDSYIQSKQLAWSPVSLKTEAAKLRAIASLVQLPASELYNQLKALNYKPYTIKSYMQRVAQLRLFHGDPSVKQFIQTNARLFKNAYTKKRVGLTFEEAWLAVRRVKHPAARQTAELMLSTGMRVHEALIYDGSGTVIGKGGKVRPVFSERRVEGQVSYSTVQAELKKVGLSSHDLRKLAATKLAANGFKEADLLEVMGWSSIQTASLYLQPMKKDQLEQQVKGLLNGNN